MAAKGKLGDCDGIKTKMNGPFTPYATIGLVNRKQLLNWFSGRYLEMNEIEFIENNSFEENDFISRL